MSRLARHPLVPYLLMGVVLFCVGGSGVYYTLLGQFPTTWTQVFFGPMLGIALGDWAIPFTAYAVASAVIVTGMMWGMGGLARYLSYQLMVIMVAVIVAVMITILLDSQLFARDRFFIPWPHYFFAVIDQGPAARGWHLAISALIGGVVSGTIAGRYFWRYVVHSRQPFGNARLATGWDLFQSGMLAKKGMILGHSHYGPLRFASYEPIIFIAGTGGGKTKAIVIPNMLELYQESVVVTDIKGEIYQATHAYRRALGQAVYRFEPAASDTDAYNPLGLLRPDHLDEDLDTVFRVLIPDSRESIWADASRNIAKMLAMHFLLEQKETPTLQKIYQWICDPNFLEEITFIHKQIKQPRVKSLFGKFMMAKEQTRRDFLLSAQEYLSRFDSPQLSHATRCNDFDFRDLRTQPMTIYLVMPANTDTYGPIAAIFFEQMIRLTAEHNEPSSKDYSITAIIDEFANLPKMPSITKGVSFLRSYRIRLCAFIQHIDQLSSLYGTHQKESLIAAPVKVAFNLTAYQDAEYCSKLAGKQTIRVKNETVHANLTRTVSMQKHYRELLTAEEVMRLSPKRLLIYRTGHPVIRARKNFWFQQACYRQCLRRYGITMENATILQKWRRIWQKMWEKFDN